MAEHAEHVPATSDDVVRLPRTVLAYPVLLQTPRGFDAGDPGTWPEVDGRLEYVGGRLLYMPPCGDVQQDVAVDVVRALGRWLDEHPGFVVGGNEAGMKLGPDTRAAEAAVWRKSDLPPRSGRFRTVPPILTVEVAGTEETEDGLRDKAAWYLGHGVSVVWIVLPERREVVVLRPDGESRHGAHEQLPACSELPGLQPAVRDLFAQIDSE